MSDKDHTTPSKAKPATETVRLTALRCFLQFNDVLINVDAIDNVQRTDDGFICYMRGGHQIKATGKELWEKLRQALGFPDAQAAGTIAVVDKTRTN